MTKSTEEMSKELHDWLKRDGECWHEWNETEEDFTCLCGYVTGSAVVLRQHIDKLTYNFFSPATEDQAAVNFFWLWERVKDKDAVVSMLNYNDCRPNIDYGLSDNLISCTELAKALYEFKEESDK